MLFVQVQTKEIAEKKKVVLADLAKVEPAVRDAQQGKTYDIHCDMSSLNVCIL